MSCATWNWILRITLAVALIFPVVLLAFAEEYTPSQIADAIYKAEGREKATFAYGIRSVSYKDKKEARQICINSIKNNYYRWVKVGKPMGFLEYMSLRYCPIGCENDRGTNKYWVRNVKYWLAKKGE